MIPREFKNYKEKTIQWSSVRVQSEVGKLLKRRTSTEHFMLIIIIIIIIIWVKYCLQD